MHKLEVTEAELKYRANNHDELRAQKQRELSCTSCGNVLSHKSQEIFSHPVLEILQCRKCNKSAKDSLKSEDSSACQICTAASRNCYKCSRKNCRSKVCQACLRRNALNSLAEAGSGQWKCFACNSKPLWKLRGVCAVVMSFNSKRTKKKQVSRNSETDNEKTNFKNISYVKSRRIDDLNKLKKRLAEICDEESSSESVESSRPSCDIKNKPTSRQQSNAHKKPEQYSGYGNILESDTSSDDCNVIEIKSISHKRPSKSQHRRESPEKIRNKNISQTDSRSWRKESRHGILTSPRKMVTPVTFASSDDSDFEESKKIMSSKRNSKDEPSRKRRKISETSANGCKLGKSKEGRKTISLETSEQDEEEDENAMDLKNPVKNVRRTNRQSGSTKAARGDTKLRKLTNEKEKVERKSNKSQYHRRLMKNDSVPSDSSSGREFHQSKLFPSYVALKRIDELEKDYTKTPEASPGTPKDTLTKDQVFALKNSVTNFFKDLKKAANQLVNDIEVVERQCCMKNSMRPTDVDDLILRTKNVVTNYKQSVDTGENKIEDYYDKWCKKAKVKNVLRAKKTSNEVDKPLPSKGESAKECSRTRNDSSAESSPVRDKSRSSSPVVQTQITNFDGISDCNSEEIFSGDEIRNSSKKSNPPSPGEENVGATSREPSVEKASIIADVSSDENLESSTPKKLSKKSPNKSSSSIEFSDHSINMDNKKKTSKLNGNPKMDSSKTSARSINLSDSDIFEDDDDDVEKEKTEEKNGNRSFGEVSDIEEQLPLIKASNPEKSPTKIDSPRSSTDSQRAAKSTNQKSLKIQQDEREEISTKVDGEKTAEDDEHSNCSRETLRDDSRDELEAEPKSPAVNDDIEAVKGPKRISEDPEDILEKTRSPSPTDILGAETAASRHVNNDGKLEKADSKSLSKNATEKESRKPGSEKKKSRSSSPIEETSKKPSSEQEMREKCTEKNNGEEKSNSPRSNNSRKRSSEDSDENDTMETDKPLKSRSNSLRCSTSSTPSEGDDLEARNKLLLSSNSEESSGAEDSSDLRISSNLENENDPQTLPESDSNISKTVANDKSDVQPETTEKKQPLKTKRTKFRMENHPNFMQDPHLRQGCSVSLKRLQQKVLDRHSKALEKSRDYVDSKKLKRLVDLDNLDKKKAASKSSNSEDDATPHKDLKNKKKGKAAKEREETLLDHLEKVKNGQNLDVSVEYGSDASDSEQDNKNKPEDLSEENNLFAEAEKMAKKRLLESSDSEKEEKASVGESSDKKDEGKKTTKKTKGAVQKEKSDRLSNDDEKREEKADKSRWRRNKLLTLRISDSDSNDEKQKSELAEGKSTSKAKKGPSESDDSEEETSPKKKRIRRRVLHSDSDGEPSPPSESESSDESDEDPKKKKKSGSDDEAKKKRKRKKKGDSSSSSSDSLEEKRPKTRRKRIKTADSESDSDLENSQGSPSKAGRKNIRKLIRDKQVADVTKQAAKDEEERLQRIAERQKLYNQMYENRLASETKVDKLVLDFNEETKETLVSVDEGLVKKLKPHQAKGIKFMWDACFESLERIKTTKGSGCILAHCMGLGKSFQIVALSHTLLQHEETGIKTIMVVCPLSTVLNWANEFKIWLENLPDGDDIEVYELTKLKQNSERKFQLQRWQKTGGVMIIGYEMFRNLSNTGKKVRKNMQDAFLHCLVDPGPDLIVCDEGHLLKNEDTALSKAMRRVRTLRRIVLTGTPLQNNLIEYHCMVQFVKPNLLGTKKEFTNRFENPITNGQFDDSTEYDVRLMKKRAHVLHKMLEGSVQRLDYSVLTPFLPPKQEYVIFVKLTEVQIKMYRHYLDNYARRVGGVGGSLFADFQALQRIWTHPLVVRLSQRQKNLANEKKRLDSDSEGSLRDFINDGSDSDTSSSGSDIQSVSNSDEEVEKRRKPGTRANPVKEEEPVALDKNEETHSDEWWEQFIKEGDCEDMRVSCKLLILFSILKQSHTIGDKVLVFSQSLYSLTLIEEFLRMIDDATHAGHEDLENLDKHSGSWSLGLDYFRLDGQTSADNRRRWCDIFNRPSNTRARLFLISTRAGGLGINLTAANRVIIFDASWNPSHDVQSIFRIYRFGQKKPCYVYRLLAAGTMEEKIYNRQVTKLSLSCRVVDEQQIERHYSNNALAELYELEVSEDEKTLNLPKDRLLADILLQYKHCVFNYHEHDSLLENQAGEELDEEERQQAWLEYEEEKKGRRILPPAPFVNYQNELFMQQTNLILAQQNAALTNPAMMLDYENIRKMMSKDYPGVSEAQQKAMATRTVYEMYNYVERQAMANQLPRINQIPLASQLPLANQMPLAMINMGTGALHFDNRQAQQPAPVAAHPTPEMIRMYQQSLNQQNGQLNFPKNKNINAVDSSAHAQNSSLSLMPQLPSQSTTLPVVDDDIIEIPASPEKILGTPPVPGGSRKSQEE